MSAVTFDGLAGTALSIASDTQLSVLSPRHAAGSVDVVVTGPDGSSTATAASRFTYIPQPIGITAPVPGGAASDPDVRLSDVDCPGNGQCVVVGHFSRPGNEFRPLANHENGGAWTPVEPPLPVDSATPSMAQLNEVACPTSTTCVAIGTYHDGTTFVPMVETWDGSRWSAARLPRPADAAADYDEGYRDLSCGGPSSCAAVGSYRNTAGEMKAAVVVLSGTGWTASVAPLPTGAAGGDLFSVDCPAAQSCTAVGHYWTDGPGQRPLSVSLSGTTWTAAAPPLPADARTLPAGALLSSVDCASATSCTAVGQYVDAADDTRALAEVSGPGAWAPVAVSAPTPASSYWELTDVSCSGPGTCTATGGYTVGSDPNVRALSASVVGATGTSVEVSSPDGSIAYLSEVDCASGGGCAAVGFSAGANSTVVASIDGGDVVSQRADLPTGSLSAQLTDVAGVAPSMAVAIGYQFLPGRGSVGLVVIMIPR